jgi:hypothetical protein
MVEVVLAPCCYQESTERVAPGYHQPKEVLFPANGESRDRSGFMQFPCSVCRHGARGAKAKILKGAEENQVDIDVLGLEIKTLNCKTFIQAFGRKACTSTLPRLHEPVYRPGFILENAKHNFRYDM